MPKGIRFASHADRIVAHVQVDADSGCWNWQSATTEHGYALVTYGLGGRGEKRTTLAHRLSYEAFVGPIPEDLQVDHLCRNRGCVNPAHLEPVTPRENIRRAPTHAAAVAAAATHCKRGHEFTDSNTYRHGQNKRRRCRTCSIEATKQARIRRALRAAGVEVAA